MCLVGCLACTGCRAKPDSFHWKSPLAWRPFRSRSTEVAQTPQPDLGANADLNESLGEPYVARQGGGSWATEPQPGPTLPTTVPLTPLAPPADYDPAEVPEFPYLPEPTRSTSQPQSVNAPGRGRRQKLNDFIDGIREGRPSHASPKSIPWDEPVADAGADVLTLAPLMVGFETYQPVTLGAPEFDLPDQRAAPHTLPQAVRSARARPEDVLDMSDVVANPRRSGGLTVFEREFKALR